MDWIDWIVLTASLAVSGACFGLWVSWELLTKCHLIF